MAVKFNPFRPNNMVGPGMFVGRVDELQTIKKCLVQTKNGNPQHFLVQGERGIGKSSLLIFVEAMGKGKAFIDDPTQFNFLVVSVDIGGSDTQLDIIRTIARGLRRSLNDQKKIMAAAKDFWEWLTNWEVLGVKYKKGDASIDTEEVADELVDQLSSFCSNTNGEIDGILLLIDETDRPDSEAGLGEYLKLLTERLARRDCNNVLVGLAGLPNIINKLRESHPSSPRLFQTLTLEPLEFHERMKVVELGLEVANSKNEVQTTITEDAQGFLAELSEGYPHFVQQFAHSAFEHDTDDVIDEDDVGHGAFKEGGALSQLGDKFFNEMYHARIASEDYRRVLDAMAEHGDDWVTRKQIIKESGVSEANVDNALTALKSKEIILHDESRRGFYRLPTNSFAAWISAVQSARAKGDVEKGF